MNYSQVVSIVSTVIIPFLIVSSVNSQGIESIHSLSPLQSESQQQLGNILNQNIIHRSSHSPIPFTSMSKPNVFLQSLEKLYRKSMEYFSSIGLSSSNKNGISRQVYEMIDIVSDVAMLTLVGIPILGLVAMSATALSPLLGSKVGASGRKKRETEMMTEDFLGKAGRSLLYARNLYEVLQKLEENFHKFGITSNDCQLKAICEVHSVGPNSDYKSFGDNILDLVRMEKDIEQHEVLPLASTIFQVYADAANHGSSHYDCSALYPRCNKDIISFIRNGKSE